MAEFPVSLFDPEDLELEAAVADLPNPAPEDPRPWEQQHGEPEKAYHAFLHYRGQPPHFHSCREAYRDHIKVCLKWHHSVVDPDDVKEPPKHWRIWSSQWGWLDRVRAWDHEINRLAVEKLMASQVEARERHVNLAREILTVLSVPVKAAITASQNADFVDMLVEAASSGPAGVAALLTHVARISGAIPAIVDMERTALGLTSTTLGLTAGPSPEESAFAFADRIPADPAATELAVKLLDHLSHASPSLALGTGVPSLTGSVADSPAPESPDDETG